jgi:rhodanese-related sulfurtransferase
LRLPFLWRLPFGQVPEITPHELRNWLGNGRSPQIVDARTGVEYRQGTIGAAQFAPLSGMPDSIRNIPLDESRPVVVLCLSGHRSRPGTRWLRARGIEAYSLQGGILAWKRAGYKLDSPEE